MTLPLLLGMALLVAAALALLLWPLFRDAKSAGSAAGISRSGLNAAVYRDQLNELERDRAAGTLDEPAFAQSTQELQRRALADTAAADPAVAQPARAKVSTSLIAGMAVIIPLAAALLYAWLGAPDASREQTSQAVVNDKHMEDMLPRSLRAWKRIRTIPRVGQCSRARIRHSAASIWPSRPSATLATFSTRMPMCSRTMPRYWRAAPTATSPASRRRH